MSHGSHSGGSPLCPPPHTLDYWPRAESVSSKEDMSTSSTGSVEQHGDQDKPSLHDVVSVQRGPYLAPSQGSGQQFGSSAAVPAMHNARPAYTYRYGLAPANLRVDYPEFYFHWLCLSGPSGFECCTIMCMTVMEILNNVE